MTDRVSAFLVILDKDISVDEMDNTVIALKQIKGVLEVQGHFGDIGQHIAEERVNAEIKRKFIEFLYSL